MKRPNPWSITRTVGCLTLAALLAGLGQATAAVSPKAVDTAQANAAKFTVLNPESPLPEIDTKALSPRLSSFAGKTLIIYDEHGGYEKPTAGLAAQLKPLLPADTKIVYYESKPGFKVEDMKGDAAIVGHGY